MLFESYKELPRREALFSELPVETLYSYPAATIVDAEGSRRALSKAQFYSSGGPTAIYIHVPFCLFLCQFCGFIKTADVRPLLIAEYVSAVLKEIDLVASFLGVHKKSIKAIYFGGGTASLLSLSQIEIILEQIYRTFTVESGAELTFEGDCLTLRRSNYLKSLADFGFGRLSFGVQTLDLGARTVLNLKPSPIALAQLCADAKNLFTDVSIDFIYAWPGQLSSDLEKDLERVVTLIQPLSLEAFRFEKLDASPDFLQALYASGIKDVSSEEVNHQRFLVTQVLETFGYKEISYSAFTKLPSSPSMVYFDCFYGYTNGNVLGFGRGAQSFLDGAMWAFNLPPHEHYSCINSGLLPVGIYGSYGIDERESVTWPKRGWVKHASLASAYDSRYAEKIEALLVSGYVKNDIDGYRLTELGLAWVPCIIEYLMPDAQYQTYSGVTKDRLESRRPTH